MASICSVGRGVRIFMPPSAEPSPLFQASEKQESFGRSERKPANTADRCGKVVSPSIFVSATCRRWDFQTEETAMKTVFSKIAQGSLIVVATMSLIPASAFAGNIVIGCPLIGQYSDFEVSMMLGQVRWGSHEIFCRQRNPAPLWSCSPQSAHGAAGSLRSACAPRKDANSASTACSINRFAPERRISVSRSSIPSGWIFLEACLLHVLRLVLPFALEPRDYGWRKVRRILAEQGRQNFLKVAGGNPRADKAPAAGHRGSSFAAPISADRGCGSPLSRRPREVRAGWGD